MVPTHRHLAVVAVVATVFASGARPVARQSPPPIELFFVAASPDAKLAVPALEAIGKSWRNGYASLIVDLARFMT